MPATFILVFGILASTLGASGLYAKTLQVYADVQRGNAIDEPGFSIITFFGLLICGLFMLSMAYKNYKGE